MKHDLLQHIQALEIQSRQLDPGPETRQSWVAATTQQAESYLAQLSEAPINVRPEHPALELLAHPPTEEALPIDEVLGLIQRNVEQVGLKPAAGGYLGYIPGGGLFPSALGDYLAAIGNHYAGVYFGSPGGVRIENLLIRWTAELLGFDPDLAGGNLTSGGSYAGMIGIHTARKVKGIRAREIENCVIYLSSQTHHASLKALNVVGLEEAILREVPLDEGFRLRPDALAQMIEADLAAGKRPFLLIASVGTTDAGAVDPIDALADLAEKYALWFHVDAAYGGYFALDPECAPLFEGVHRVDSLVIDPHKSLFTALGTGMALVKNRQHLLDTYQGTAAYMQDIVQDASEISPADLSPELSKHFRGLRMWMPLKLFGVAPFRAALQEKRYLAQWFYRQLQERPGFETPLPPDLSVVLFRYLPATGEANPFNQALIQLVQQDQKVFLSSTTIAGTYYLRLAVLHFRTHLEQVRYVLELLEKCVAQLEKPFNPVAS